MCVGGGGSTVPVSGRGPKGDPLVLQFSPVHVLKSLIHIRSDTKLPDLRGRGRRRVCSGSSLLAGRAPCSLYIKHIGHNLFLTETW